MYAHKERNSIPKERGGEKLQNDKLSGSNAVRYRVGGQRECETEGKRERGRERETKKVKHRVRWRETESGR